MKRIICGKKYDTDTAEKIARWDNGLSVSDFDFCEESLHIKRTGEFFLHGEGGPNSKYAKAVDNCFTGGEKIIPLSENEAKKWVENHANEKYEQIFGEVEE